MEKCPTLLSFQEVCPPKMWVDGLYELYVLYALHELYAIYVLYALCELCDVFVV